MSFSLFSLSFSFSFSSPSLTQRLALTLTLCLLALLPSPIHGANATEAQTLLALKTSWMDPFGILANWSANSVDAPCSWIGITCSNDSSSSSSNVIGIDLRGNLTGGSLNSSLLSQLPELQTLILSGNNLSGSIPPSIAQLSKLSTLVLSNNQLEGSIPENTSLRYLELEGNRLSGTIPTELGQNLETLDLSSNSLQGEIPATLGSLASLRNLILHDNNLSGPIPSALPNATSLRVLMLENNGLTGEIPPGFGDIPRIYYLALENNSLTGPLPSDFTRFPALASLYAGNNQLNGSLPESIGNLASTLFILHLQGNQFTGPIPPSIANLSLLQELQLSGNELDGEIPNELGQLGSLNSLDLSNNKLSGEIPASLGDLNSLQTLELSFNNLSGQIPTTLGNFSAASFEANPGLCGWPLNNLTCLPVVLVPSPAPQEQSTPTPATTGSITMPLAESEDTMNLKLILGPAFGILGFLIIVGCVYLLVRSRSKKPIGAQTWLSSELVTSRATGKTAMFSDNLSPYTYKLIAARAGGFDNAHLLGEGRYAAVYLAVLPDTTRMAVKVFHDGSRIKESFEQKLETLRIVKHPYLLPVLGYYSGPAEKAIFYEAMPRRSLYDLLRDLHSLPDWQTRVRIVAMAAQGVASLHRGYRMLHKDIKSSNILLDTALVPRVSDYGLAGLAWPQETIDAETGDNQGYTAPELLQSNQTNGSANNNNNKIKVTKKKKRYSEQSDVYAFGVVLLEVLTGRKPVTFVSNNHTVSLVTWATRLHKERRNKEVFDPKVVETCPLPDQLDKALNLAILCTNEIPTHRPTMSEVASILEAFISISSPNQSPDMNPHLPLLA